ncbi:MAG: hypothetical protein EOO27_14015, partial [Comamonadaceae bacterium]
HGTTALQAGRDLLVRQATIDSHEGVLSVHATRDVKIEAGEASAAVAGSHQTTTKAGGLSGLFGGKITETLSGSFSATRPVGSRLSGDLLSVTAGRDIDIEGSHLSGSAGVKLGAGRELVVREARERASSTIDFDSRKSATASLSPVSGVPIPTGAKSSRTSVERRSDAASPSTITSARGGVLLEGETVRLQGPQIEAARTLRIEGGDVAISAAVNEQNVTTGSAERGASLGAVLRAEPGTGLRARSQEGFDGRTTTLARTTLEAANIEISARKGGASSNGTSSSGMGNGTGKEAGTEDGASAVPDAGNASGSGWDSGAGSGSRTSTSTGTLTLSGTTIATPGTLTLRGEQVDLAPELTEASLGRQTQGKDVMWQKAADEGQSRQSTHYNQLTVGQLAIEAPRIAIGLGAQQSVEALAQQPGMQWVGKLASDPAVRDRVDWYRVEEAHKRWNYSQQGLTPEGAAIVTLVATFVTYGAASSAGVAAGAAAGGGTTGAVVGGAVTAGVTALAAQSAVALVNNRGDLGKALDDLGSSASVKGLVTSILTGGVLGGLNLNPTGQATAGTSMQTFAERLGTNLRAGLARAVIGTAVNGGSFADNLKTGLKQAVIDTGAAQLAIAIGDAKLDTFTNKVAHAIAGCAAGAASTGSSGCAAGALGAAVGEIAAEAYGRKEDTVQFASMVSGLAAAAAGMDAGQIHAASQAGGNASANNYLSHSPFDTVRAEVAQENARLTAQCEAQGCTLEQYQQIDRSMATLDRVLTGRELIARDQFTTEQAQQLAQNVLELVPLYGTGESLVQLVTGKASVTGEDVSLFWAAIGAVPLAGGVIKRVAEPTVDALRVVLRESGLGVKGAAGANGGVTTIEAAIASGSPITTRFVDGVKVVDQRTGSVFNGTVDLQPTFDRIVAGGTGISRNDGAVFRNLPNPSTGQSLLPTKPAGYYTEYVVPTPSIAGPGPQRIVAGQSGEMFYTPDHYATFIPIKKP